MTRKFNVKTEDADYVVAVVKCVWQAYIEAAIYLTTSISLLLKWNTAWKVSKYGVIYDTYFPTFELNTEIYAVNLRIQSKYR